MRRMAGSFVPSLIVRRQGQEGVDGCPVLARRLVAADLAELDALQDLVVDMGQAGQRSVRASRRRSRPAVRSSPPGPRPALSRRRRRPGPHGPSPRRVRSFRRRCSPGKGVDSRRPPGGSTQRGCRERRPGRRRSGRWTRSRAAAFLLPPGQARYERDLLLLTDEGLS